MDDLRENLIVAIKEFVNFAIETDDLFKKQFHITVPPLKAVKSKKQIPPIGYLDYNGEKIKYRFHGFGCEFIIDEKTIIDFNYKPPDWNFEGFSFFKFWNFVKDKLPEFKEKELLKEYLTKLEDEYIIKIVKPPYLIYNLVDSL